MASVLVHGTADADFVTGDAYLKSVALAAGADTGTAEIREGGAAGTVRLILRAVTNTSALWTAADPKGVRFNGSIYVNVTGTTPSVTVEYEPA